VLQKHQNTIKSRIVDIILKTPTLYQWTTINQGFNNIIATDISEIVLNKLKERLGTEKASKVRWIVDDITQPIHIQNLRDISIWHDRAVLHFLLKENQQQVYLSTLKKVIKKGGYVIIAAFSLEGAKNVAVWMSKTMIKTGWQNS
jgi:ubiquinone/menaquinone biosynthesis C-methylase UbiE